MKKYMLATDWDGQSVPVQKVKEAPKNEIKAASIQPQITNPSLKSVLTEAAINPAPIKEEIKIRTFTPGVQREAVPEISYRQTRLPEIEENHTMKIIAIGILITIAMIYIISMNNSVTDVPKSNQTILKTQEPDIKIEPPIEKTEQKKTVQVVEKEHIKLSAPLNVSNKQRHVIKESDSVKDEEEPSKDLYKTLDQLKLLK